MFLLTSAMTMAQKLFMGSPDGRLDVKIEVNGGVATYAVYYDGVQVLEVVQGEDRSGHFKSGSSRGFRPNGESEI